MQRHFTATAFVFNDKGQTLLLWHKRFRRWMPPGGHVEPNELPHEAAIRECYEETGLHIVIDALPGDNIFSSNPSEGCVLPLPHMLLLEHIPASLERNEPSHQHMDFVYTAHPLDASETVLHMAADEAQHLAWFSLEEIEALSPDDLFENVRTLLRSLMNPNR